MALYQPKQRRNDDGTPGRWDMTCTNGAGTFPIGDCGRDGACGGHDSGEEAQACWAKHRLDNDLSFGETEHQQRRCEVCEHWTTGVAYLRGEFPHEWPLCNEHRSREGVDKAIKSARVRGHTLDGGRVF